MAVNERTPLDEAEQERINAYVRHYEQREKRHWTERSEELLREELQ